MPTNAIIGRPWRSERPHTPGIRPRPLHQRRAVVLDDLGSQLAVWESTLADRGRRAAAGVRLIALRHGGARRARVLLTVRNHHASAWVFSPTSDGSPASARIRQRGALPRLFACRYSPLRSARGISRRAGANRIGRRALAARSRFGATMLLNGDPSVTPELCATRLRRSAAYTRSGYPLSEDLATWRFA